MDNLPELIHQRLSQRSPSVHADMEACPAAVLLPLFQDRGKWHLLYTRRTDTVESHRGQVAFPGGVIDVGDDNPIQAALREAYEEIGLLMNDVEVLGMLDTIPTITQFIIWPIVGVIPWPYPLRLNGDEVATTFGVPLTWLTDPKNLEVHLHEPPFPGPSIPVHHFKPYQGEVIWGATARITIRFLDIVRDIL